MTVQPQQRIGGWLIPLGILLIVFALRTTVYLVALAPAVRIATSTGVDAVSKFGVFYEIGGNALNLVGTVSLIVLFFSRRRWFPRLAVAFLVVFVAFTVGDLLLALSVPEAAARPTLPWRNTLFVAAVSALTAWYVCVSERIRSTFTR